MTVRPWNKQIMSLTVFLNVGFKCVLDPSAILILPDNSFEIFAGPVAVRNMLHDLIRTFHVVTMPTASGFLTRGVRRTEFRSSLFR